VTTFGKKTQRLNPLAEEGEGRDGDWCRLILNNPEEKGEFEKGSNRLKDSHILRLFPVVDEGAQDRCWEEKPGFEETKMRR